MKIAHICLGTFFPDRCSYQENMLPKFHKQMGLDVEVITSLITLDEYGKKILYSGPSVYFNEYDIKVTRLKYKKPEKLFTILKSFKGLRECLEKATPDIIFVHNCQFLDINIILQYVKKKDVKLFIDNHGDFMNSAKNWFSKNIMHKLIWKRYAKKIEPYVERFYGVLPARVSFLKNVYGISDSKCELLVMGADDEMVELVRRENRNIFRESMGISESDFVIVSGGKINKYRPEVLFLLQAIHELDSASVKMIFFGNVEDEYKDIFDKYVDNEKIINVGWIDSRESYKYIAIADLAVYPGLHSVLWEQTVGQGIPCVFRDIEGFHHVDCGGNAIFLKEPTVKSLCEILNKLVFDNSRMCYMKQIAEDVGMKKFLYSEIAKRSINL